jgi:hypothetical protein
MLTFSRSFILVNKYLCNLDEQPLNAFEQQREEQIAENHRKMEELGLRVGPKPVSPKVKKKSSTKGRHGEDFKYTPEPGELVKGFVDTDETFKFRR